MKKVRKISAIVLTLVLALSALTIAPITADAATPAWKTAYKNYVYNQSSYSSLAEYYLIDVDGNGIPELFYDSGYGLGGGSVSTYGNIMKTCITDSYGNTRINKNRVFFSSGSQGTYTRGVYEVTSGTINLLIDERQTLKNGYFPGTSDPNAYNYCYAYFGASAYTYVSAAEYDNILNSYFDINKGKLLSSYKAYTATQVITAINNYQSKLAAPSLTVSNKSNGIRAEWNKVSGAAKYIVYYKKSSDKNWKSVTTTNTYYPLLNTTPGTKYSFQVQAVASGGAKGNYSKVASLEFKLMATAVTLSNKSNGIRAEWSKVPGAAKYIIYYKKSSDSGWKSTTTTNTYYPVLNTTAGTKYSVQVQAVASNGAKGYYSKVATLEFKLMATTVTLSNKSNGIRAEWSKVPGAAYYIVYYRNADTAAWSQMAAKNLYYPILNTQKGEKYCVQVQAVASNGAKGYYSKVYSLTFN